MKLRRRTGSELPAATGSVDGRHDKLTGMRPVRLDYDEARTAAERDTYNNPMDHPPGEFLVHLHPVTRVRSLLGRATRRR